MELKREMLSHKKFKFNWGNQTEFVQIEITIPKIHTLKYSVWGDWGPMYSIQLNKLEPIEIRYNQDLVKSRQNTLGILSPMELVERDNYPFYLSIEDDDKDICFSLYIDREYNLGKIKATRKNDNLKLFENVVNEVKLIKTSPNQL